jgi:hypothetical protein
MTPEQLEKRRAYQRAYATKQRQERPEHTLAIARKSRTKRIEQCRADCRLRARRRAGIVDATAELRGGACALCGGHYAKLNLDHDKATGLARGWLCTACNTALGRLGDNAAGLSRALAYVRGM